MEHDLLLPPLDHTGQTRVLWNISSTANIPAKLALGGRLQCVKMPKRWFYKQKRRWRRLFEARAHKTVSWDGRLVRFFRILWHASPNFAQPLTIACSPNEDFGRLNRRSGVSPLTGSTFQWYEHKIWATIHWNYVEKKQIVCSDFQNLRLGSIQSSKLPRSESTLAWYINGALRPGWLSSSCKVE